MWIKICQAQRHLAAKSKLGKEWKSTTDGSTDEIPRGRVWVGGYKQAQGRIWEGTLYKRESKSQEWNDSTENCKAFLNYKAPLAETLQHYMVLAPSWVAPRKEPSYLSLQVRDTDMALVYWDTLPLSKPNIRAKTQSNTMECDPGTSCIY